MAFSIHLLAFHIVYLHEWQYIQSQTISNNQQLCKTLIHKSWDLGQKTKDAILFKLTTEIECDNRYRLEVLKIA